MCCSPRVSVWYLWKPLPNEAVLGLLVVVVDGTVGWSLSSTVSTAAAFADIQNESFDPSVAVPALWLKAGTLLMWSDLAFPVQFNYN